MLTEYKHIISIQIHLQNSKIGKLYWDERTKFEDWLSSWHNCMVISDNLESILS